MAEVFDVAVLGGGPGGYAAALRAATRGANVCCIEQDHVGGTCLNVGCIPTKAMLHAAGLVYGASAAEQFGVSMGAPSVDGPAFMQRVAKVVAGLRKGVEGLLKARKVTLIRGRGRLTGTGEVAVETDAGLVEVQAGAVIIATGSRPATLDFLPKDSPRVWTTNEATTASDLPESVIILGGGVIGCEFATAYAELGIPTTVVEMLDSLVSELGADASKAVTRSLKKRKVNIRIGARVTGVSADGDGVRAELADGTLVEASHMLVCVGRKPNVEDIGLDVAGVEIAGGVIAVDDRCLTSAPNAYAVGDVAEQCQYAHLATRMGLVAADNACGHDAADDRTVVPAGVYTHPQVATVGLTQEQAGDDARAAQFPLQACGLAQVQGKADGVVKIIAGDTGLILGAVIVAPNATDLIQEIAIAMRHGLTVEQVAETIHAHPTMVETLGEAAESWLGLPLHTLR